MAKGSQLAQLKSAISAAGLSRKDTGKGKKKTKSTLSQTDKEKRAKKLHQIQQSLNPFDVKTTKLKHDTGGRKTKGQVGRPQASKQAGIENRKKTLLKEYQTKEHAGGIIDRRFGENDPTMAPEERMLERFTKERQHSSKGAIFNLQDEEELTHYGQSLSKLDDFDVGFGAGLNDDEDDGRIDQETVKRAHFGGFEDDEASGDETGEPRKKSKAEVMAEVMAKSKEHKYQRQLERQQDDSTRYQLDAEFESIRALLVSGQDQSTDDFTRVVSKTNARADPFNTTEDAAYDQRVRELALDKRATPKDRTKTEEEQALEAKEALEKAEKKRLKRMNGEDGQSGDEDENGKEKKRRRGMGGDDLEDDFDVEDVDYDLGAGLDENVDAEDAVSADEEGSAEESDDNDDDSVEDDSGDISSKKHEPSSKTKKTSSKELPFTFPCPETHEKFLAMVENVEDKDIPTVIQRVRTLYHPSFAEGNKIKLGNLTTVLIDYILHITAPPLPNFTLLSAIIPHLLSLTKSYPIQSAEHFKLKLKLMQKNLTKGLSHGATNSNSRTWPGPSELALLYTIAAVWPTSDLNHAVISPARLLMGTYLGLARVRHLSDLISGSFLCTLWLQYESLSHRFVPEAVPFLLNTLLHICHHKFADEESLPGYFPSPDLNSSNTRSLKLSKKASVLDPRTPKLGELLAHSTVESEQTKVDIMGLSLDMLGKFAEMYKDLDGFVELYQPALDILEALTDKGLSEKLQAKLSGLKAALQRLLKFASEARRPLQLQAHKPIPIATYIPKFESHSSSYLRAHDPDHERAQASKLRHQYKQERKGAIRELRKDARFLAGVQRKEQQEKDKGYKDSMNHVFNSLEGERAEQKKMEREKAKDKRRAGRK